MAFLNIAGAQIVGFSAGVPSSCIINGDSAFVDSTGVACRRGNPHLTTSDLGVPAAEKLIADLHWTKNSIDALIFVSQTADYILPATACIIQNRLGLPTTCFATDISLGCSGWVYGVSFVASLVSSGKGQTFNRALLFAGDSKPHVPGDQPLFGAACSVTAIQYNKEAKPMLFEFGTDGSGYDAIIIPDGGCRNGISLQSFDEYEYEGHKYNRLQTRMNGIDVFSFGISIVPKSIRSLAEQFDLNYHTFDYYIFHQANLSILKAIERKLNLDPTKVPLSIRSFGNTSSASIPLTIVTQLKGKIEKRPVKLLCCGFGVGLSWGTLAYESDDVFISDLVEVE